jgi:hypothetical protein
LSATLDLSADASDRTWLVSPAASKQGQPFSEEYSLQTVNLEIGFRRKCLPGYGYEELS